jgi:large subunit ribosomal protein L23
MAIFKSKKEKTSANGLVTKKEKTQKTHNSLDYSSILVRQRITEKGTKIGQSNAYVFDVAPGANKILITKAVQHYFNVKAKKVRIVQVPNKRKLVRGREGVKTGGKKAYVYLNKADKMTIS